MPPHCPQCAAVPPLEEEVGVDGVLEEEVGGLLLLVEDEDEVGGLLLLLVGVDDPPVMPNQARSIVS